MRGSTKPISALRQRMIEDMRLRKLNPKTQRADLRAVMNFTPFLRRAPDTAEAEDLRRYQLRLVEQGTSSGPVNATITGLKFFFEVTVDRPEAMKRMRHVYQPRKLPEILSLEEVTRLLENAGGLKYQAALGIAYGAAHRATRLAFFGPHRALAEANVFVQSLARLCEIDWVVYAKRPFSGPAAVLAYLSRYTHRIAISNRLLIAHDDRAVTFRWKDYRAKPTQRYKTLRLTPEEFIRRFLIHVLPSGFHRIRHYGLFANGVRAENLAQTRALLGVRPPADAETAEPDPTSPRFLCPTCGQAMRIIETFESGYRAPAPPHRGGDPP